jgi:hypothetical protein
MWAAEAAQTAEYVDGIVDRLMTAAIAGDIVLVTALVQAAQIEAGGLKRLTARLHEDLASAATVVAGT